jgi:hypothetical protein
MNRKVKKERRSKIVKSPTAGFPIYSVQITTQSWRTKWKAKRKIWKCVKRENNTTSPLMSQKLRS